MAEPILLYDNSKWKDMGSFWIFDVPQRDPAWILVKIGRPSGSTIGYCLNHSKFSTPDKSALDLCCMKYNFIEVPEVIFGNTTVKQIIDPIRPILLGKENKSENSKRVMDLGTKNESLARDKYISWRKVQCEELGYAVSKLHPHIGVSIDGDVKELDGNITKGIVEIKSPEHMYEPIKNYITSEVFIRKHMRKIPRANKDMKIWKLKTYEHDYHYIWQTHYDQMQMGMGILSKLWCDYIVDSLDGFTFIKRVYFNQEYWDNMIKDINIFIQHKISPLLAYLNQTGIENILKFGLGLDPSCYLPQKLTFLLMPT